MATNTSNGTQEDFLGFDDPPYVTTSSPNINFFQNTIAKIATPEQKKSFISVCASIIRENYSGDPLSLASFIDKITLIEELSDESLTTTFIAFLKSKLEGKARESLPTQISSVSQIKEALSNKIKPDNSKVVAGKISALKVHNNNYSDFAKQVEELADSLERSLIIEGMTQAKAHEMAVEQTINVCRLNSRSDMVKSILASSTFGDSKDVVARTIVEHDNIIQERQVLAFRSRPKRTNNFRGGYRGSNNYRYHNNNFRFNGNSNRHSGNTSYRNNNQNRNNNFSNRRNNYNNSNNSQASSSRNTRNSANVRTLDAEAPQARTLGELDLNN
ncbi:PREDICTED: putative uncharacterized protein DDB_G0278921 [Rhagoletis zephyria]|uniref:putative uncharacterized protein DDB_G0278921 n=1 Tax=Rhagoletis zephyria TaxID=28612 RepID=UPI000811A03E|nr:PREDICTED: putative uncharacterized protein DDB_G0278921 [Rhagoletis zephyria]